MNVCLYARTHARWHVCVCILRLFDQVPPGKSDLPLDKIWII